MSVNSAMVEEIKNIISSDFVSSVFDPRYNFYRTESNIDKVQRGIRAIKNAINNTTGFDKEHMYDYEYNGKIIDIRQCLVAAAPFFESFVNQLKRIEITDMDVVEHFNKLFNSAVNHYNDDFKNYSLYFETPFYLNVADSARLTSLFMGESREFYNLEPDQYARYLAFYYIFGLRFNIKAEQEQNLYKNIIKDLYGSLDPFKDSRYNADLTFGFSLLTSIDWATNLMKKIKISDKIIRSKLLLPDFDKKLLDKLVKPKNSPMIKFLTGEIDSKKFEDLRYTPHDNKKVTDFELELLVMNLKDSGPRIETSLKSMGYSFRLYMHYVGDRNYYAHAIDLSKAYINSFGTKNSYSKASEREDKLKEEIKNKDDEINKLNDQINRNIKAQHRADKDLSDAKREIDKLKSELHKCKANTVSTVEVDKNQSLIKEKDDKIKELTDQINAKDTELLEIKSEDKKLKKKVRLLDLYNRLYNNSAKLDEKEEIPEEQKIIPLAQKVEALKQYRIVACTLFNGYIRKLQNMGLNIQIFDDATSTIRKTDFDIVVIYTAQCKHQMVRSIEKYAKKKGAIELYYNGTNDELMINLLYNKLIVGENNGV